MTVIHDWDEVYEKWMKGDVMPNSEYCHNTDAHVKLKVSGNLQKIAFFHYLVGQFDNDWPWSPNRRRPEKDLKCTQCGGAKYHNPRFDADDIKKFSEMVNAHKDMQGNLKVRIKMFRKGGECKL